MPNEEKGLYDGYRTEEKRNLALLQAALLKDPSIFGEMTPEVKEEYDRLVEWIKTVPEGCTIDVGYNME